MDKEDLVIDEYFKNNDAALRVREKSGVYQLTLKIKKELGNVEYNFDIDISTFIDMVHEKRVPIILADYIDENLVLENLSQINTMRHVISYGDHKIEVDQTNFEDIVDYEIEVESTSIANAKKVFDSFLKDLDITSTESKPKIERYHDYHK